MEDEGAGGSGLQIEGSNSIPWSWGYYWYRGGQAYGFAVDDITLEKGIEGWVITDWGKICETTIDQQEHCE
jgi:hypothetical protein